MEVLLSQPSKSCGAGSEASPARVSRPQELGVGGGLEGNWAPGFPPMLAGVGVLGKWVARGSATGAVTDWHLVRSGQAWRGLHSHLGALCWARARRETSGTGKLQQGTGDPGGGRDGGLTGAGRELASSTSCPKINAEPERVVSPPPATTPCLVLRSASRSVARGGG